MLEATLDLLPLPKSVDIWLLMDQLKYRIFLSFVTLWILHEQ